MAETNKSAGLDHSAWIMRADPLMAVWIASRCGDLTYNEGKYTSTDWKGISEALCSAEQLASPDAVGVKTRFINRVSVLDIATTTLTRRFRR